MSVNLGKKMPTGKTAWEGSYVYSNFPALWVKDASVKIEGLADEMQPLMTSLNKIATKHSIKFIITSGNDAIHCKGSKHYIGRAIDLSFREGGVGSQLKGWGDKGALFQEVNETLNPIGATIHNYFVLWEYDHVHIAYDPRKAETMVMLPMAPINDVSDTQRDKSPTKVQVRFCHTNPQITTLEELVNSGLCIFEPYRGKVSDLANIKAPNGKTNRELIESMYVNPDENNKSEEWPLLKVGTVIFVDADTLRRDFMSVESLGQSKNFNEYTSYFTNTQSELDRFRKEGKYVPAIKLSSWTNHITVNTVYVNSFFRVWIYSKALNQVLDVTRYVRSVDTQTNLMGGDSFSLSMLYIIHPEGYVADSRGIVGNVDIQDAFREMSYFFKNLGENDIVFISFETLKIEKDRDVSVQRSLVSKDDLGQQYYDFIGLINVVQQTSNPDGRNEITVTGASLEKLFDDDEAVYRPISVVGDSFSGNLLFGDKKKRGWFGRMFADDAYHNLITHSFRTIENTMKFFMNMVSNVGFLPLEDNGSDNTTLFSSYAYIDEDGKEVDDRSYLFNFDDDGNASGGTVSTELARGIYQIVKLSVDPQLASRKLTDANVTNPQGSILSLFRMCCQRYLTEIVMDTFKNTFDVIVRTPPFTFNAIKAYQSKFFEIDSESVANESFTWEEDFYTWFELQPRGNMVPYSTMEAMAYIPVLFLREYIDLWGPKCLSVVSPYGTGVVGEDREQSIQDICQIVESNFYLPFTRRGVITLSVPDRRIRKGMWIKYNKTGEIFYVEGVSQSVSVSTAGVQRNTVISVSRGLVEKYVFDEENGYFSIIDFNALSEQVQGLTKQNKASSLVPTINGRLFNFFVERKQFKE